MEEDENNVWDDYNLESILSNNINTIFDDSLTSEYSFWPKEMLPSFWDDKQSTEWDESEGQHSMQMSLDFSPSIAKSIKRKTVKHVPIKLKDTPMDKLKLYRIHCNMKKVINSISTGEPTVKANPRSHLDSPKITKLDKPKRSRAKGVSRRSFNIIKEKLKPQHHDLNRISIFQGKYEEIVRLTKIDDDLDEDVDVVGDTTQMILPKPIDLIKEATHLAARPSCHNLKLHKVRLPQSKYMVLSQRRLEAVYSLPPPTEEQFFEFSQDITVEERKLFPEFFRVQKKSERYLTIRKHIVKCWLESRPNYVAKTFVRSGLKNCGDVNTISRVHSYLEQKGYINFGCDQCHYKKKQTVTAVPRSLIESSFPI